MVVRGGENMVKKYLMQISVFVMTLFFIPSWVKDWSPVANTSDLHKLIGGIENFDGSVTEWSLLARESLDSNLTTTDLLHKFNRWEEQFPQFTWKRVQNQERLELIATFSDPDKNYEETLHIVADLNETTLEGFTLYELKGTSWNQETKKIINQKGKFFPQWFNKSPIIFTCIKGELPDNMNIAAEKWAMDITESFGGQVIEQLREENFVSITAKSSEFGQFLQSEHEKFNLQIAIRKGMPGEKTSFTVGTPILTIEY